MTREFLSGDRVSCRHGGLEREGAFITGRDGMADLVFANRQARGFEGRL